MIEHKWDIVDDYPTYILQTFKAPEKQDIIIIIPGNPGSADYYRDFISVLNEKLDEKCGIICISHAGHNTIPKQFSNYKKYATLNDQIYHKVEFIKKTITNKCRLVLIGHSIGCYIILHMLNKMETLKNLEISKCIFLFPTIEKMAESPRGKSFVANSKYISWLLPLISNVIYFAVPRFVLEMLISYFLGDIESKKCAIEGTLKILSPLALSNSFKMAEIEMKTVTQPDHDIISRFINKIFFFYGEDDHWCPLQYCQDMKNIYPTANIRIADKKHKHAFVLDSSQEVACICVEEIKKELFQ